MSTMTKSQVDTTTGHSLPQQQWNHPDLLKLAPSASRASCAELQFYGMPNFHNSKENRDGNQDRTGQKDLCKRLREFEASLEDVQGKRASSRSSEVARSSDNWIHERLLLFNSLVSDFKIVSHKMDMELLLVDQQVSNQSSDITREDIARKLLLIQFKLVYLVYICDPELHCDLMMSSHSSSSPFSYTAKDAEVINPISLSNVLDLISFTLHAAAPDINENSVDNGSSGSGKINLIISTLRKTVLFYDTNALILHCQAWFPSPKEYHEFIQGLFQAYSQENVWIGNEILLQHVLKEDSQRNKVLIGKLLERHVEAGASKSSEGGRYNRLFAKLLIASSTTTSRSRPNHFRPLDLRQLHLITDRLFQASTCASTAKSPTFANDQLFDCLLKSLDFHLHTQYSNNQLHHHTPSDTHAVSPLLIQVQDTLASLISIHHLPASGDILWHLLFKHLYSKNITTHKKSLHTLLDFYCRQNRQCEALSKYKSVLALLVRPVMKGRARWGRTSGRVIEDQVHEWQDWWKGCCVRNNCTLILPTL